MTGCGVTDTRMIAPTYRQRTRDSFASVMPDLETALAFALQSQPGVYAALVGSGVSRAAEIPTGWGIVNDLIERLAATRNESTSGEPARWFTEAFGEPAGFSSLLKQLAPTATDRRALLAGYIEPELGRDHRRPTSAHRAFARLARTGHIRLFVTTNFDRLLEQAMHDEGIQPLVVASEAQAAGATPFHHAGVVVFKIHGDYLDPDSMLVTEDELAAYQPAILERLARCVEDYGLIVCGWSGEWDPALRDVLAAARSRRYPLYFTHRGPPSTAAGDLIRARDGIALPIDDADRFASRLEARVAALEAVARPHPLDLTALTAQLKKALPVADRVIDVEDLVVAETERLVESVTDLDRFPTSAASLTNDASGIRFLVDQSNQYVGAAESLVYVAAVGLTYGGSWHDHIWTRMIERVGRIADQQLGGQTALLALRHLPTLLIAYAGSLAAIDRGNFGGLRALMIDARVPVSGAELPVIAAAHAWRPFSDAPVVPTVLAIEADTGEKCQLERIDLLRSGREGKRYTPGSDFLHAQLRNAFIRTIPDSTRFTTTFDRTEVVLSFLANDARLAATSGGYFPPAHYGAFTWRNKFSQNALEAEVAAECRANAEQLLRAGLFGGDSARLEAALDATLEGAANARERQW